LSTPGSIPMSVEATSGFGQFGGESDCCKSNPMR
jgi:hypothetical protein